LQETEKRNNKECAIAASGRKMKERKQEYSFAECAPQTPGLHPTACFKRYHAFQEYGLAYGY
jgi:hypothetical protein